MKLFRPNRKWAQLLFGFIGLLAIVNLLLLSAPPPFLVAYSGFLFILILAYKVWVDWTYIRINENQLIQISTSLYKKKYDISNIREINWTGSQLDGILVVFHDDTKFTLSPALFDKSTLNLILNEILLVNSDIELSRSVKKLIEELPSSKLVS